MTTTTEIDLRKVYTQEEQSALFDAYIDALDNNDDDAANQISAQMPIHPHWAKIILKVFGREFLEKYFNVTEADRILGEGWMNG